VWGEVTSNRHKKRGGGHAGNAAKTRAKREEGRRKILGADIVRPIPETSKFSTEDGSNMKTEVNKQEREGKKMRNETNQKRGNESRVDARGSWTLYLSWHRSTDNSGGVAPGAKGRKAGRGKANSLGKEGGNFIQGGPFLSCQVPYGMTDTLANDSGMDK